MQFLVDHILNIKNRYLARLCTVSAFQVIYISQHISDVIRNSDAEAGSAVPEMARINNILE